MKRPISWTISKLIFSIIFGLCSIPCFLFYVGTVEISILDLSTDIMIPSFLILGFGIYLWGLSIFLFIHFLKDIRE